MISRSLNLQTWYQVFRDQNDHVSKKPCLEINPRVRLWSDDLHVFTINLCSPETWKRAIPSVILSIALWRAFVDEKTDFATLSLIDPAVVCVFRVLRSFSVTFFIPSDVVLNFSGLLNPTVCLTSTSQSLSSMVSSPNIISPRHLKHQLKHAHVRLSHDMLLGPCEHIERGPLFRTDPMIRDLQRTCHPGDCCVFVSDDFGVNSIYSDSFLYLFESVW